MSQPFDIGQAVNDLYNVKALANAAKAIVADVGIHEVGDDGWRVLDMLEARLLTVINQLDALDLRQSEAARA